MKKWLQIMTPTISIFLFFAIILWPGASSTFPQKEGEEGKALSPDEVMTGEVHIALNSDFPKFRVDGEEWEEHEFTDNGTKLVIHSMRRDRTYKISFTPLYNDLEPVEIELKPEDWKLKPIGKNVKMWTAEKKIVFQKKKIDKPAAEQKK